MPRRPSIGDKARTEKVMFSVTPEMLDDFRAVAFVENVTMAERLIKFMEQDIKDHAEELKAIREIQKQKENKA